MQGKKLGFIGQLDSFRFLAVFLVTISHWISNSTVSHLPLGYLGVTFFFTLSGFLISFNLLVNHQSIIQEDLKPRKAVLNFYLRRSLRIFPLYFLVLGLVWLANKNIFDGRIIWYLTYSSNFLFFITQSWQEMLSHFWSLGVEEQFYIVWPFLILFIPTAFILRALIVTITLSLGYKLVMAIFFPGVFQPDLLPISAFDAFGLGAILAYQRVFNKSFRILDTRHMMWAIPILDALIVAYAFGYLLWLKLFFPFVSVLVIHQALTGFRGITGFLLNNRFMMYLGKISYGLYIYHNFVPWIVRCLRGIEYKYPIALKPVLSNWQPSTLMLMIFQFILLITIASFSWFSFEKPFNNLKRYF